MLRVFLLKFWEKLNTLKKYISKMYAYLSGMYMYYIDENENLIFIIIIDPSWYSIP